MKGKEQAQLHRDADRAMKRQSKYSLLLKTVTGKCPICGKEVVLQKSLLQSRYLALREIYQDFSLCRTCLRFICEACYLVDDGEGNGISICSECAAKQGVTGLTLEQAEKAWPELERRMKERYKIQDRGRLERERPE